MTVLAWLEKNHPIIFAQWAEFQNEWQKRNRRKSYQPTGKKPGRPAKS